MQNPKEPHSPTRRFVDVTKDELMQAVIKMVNDLGISGSSTGYSLYTAVFAEHDKAIAASQKREQQE